MSALLFDTLQLSLTLRDKGHFTSEQAEALAEALGAASQDNLATKVDLNALATKAELSEVKTTLAVVQAELALVKWLVSGIGFGVLLLVLKSFWPGHTG